MVHPRGRRLDPPQPPPPHHSVPIDGNLGMPAEDVGLEEFFGDPLLAGIDDLRFRNGGRNLLDMSRVDRITEDDAHQSLTLLERTSVQHVPPSISL